MNTYRGYIYLCKKWRASHGISDEAMLTDNQIEVFLRELQEEICKMDFSYKRVLIL